MSGIRIVGQGLAGTALGWACEWGGVDFRILDRGHGTAASAVSGGLINPVTGQRFVKSWRVAELLPLALDFYRRVEAELGVPLLHPLRGWRVFRDAREAERWAAKHATGELAPFDRGPLARETVAEWTEAPHGGADFGEVWRIDVPRFLAASRARWLAAGRLEEREWAAGDAGPPDGFAGEGSRAATAGDLPSDSTGAPLRGSHPPVTILCTGAALAGDARLPANGTVAFGEIAEFDCADFPPETMINAGHWFVPLAPGRILGGASYRPNGRGSPEDGVVELAHAAKQLLGGSARLAAVRTGARFVAADKLPVAGWLDAEHRLGVCAALGSKGALFAPWLARQWLAHLTEGAAFAVEVAPSRLPPPGGIAGAAASE